jgi:uncharacterized protein (UPF0335 family)
MELTPPILEIIISILTVGVAYGIVKTQLDTLKESISKLEKETDKMRSAYVTYHHFNEVVAQMRVEHSELKADVKEVIRILSAPRKRPRDL